MKIPPPPRFRGPSIQNFTRFCYRALAGAGLLLVVVFAAGVLWLRYVTLPNVESWRPQLIASIESASGMAVDVRRLEGGWEGLRPRLSMEGFALNDRKGRAALAFDRAQVTLSWWALLLGEVRFHDIAFERPELVLRRGTDGLIYLADKPLTQAGPGDGQFSRWLLEQPNLQIHNATLLWRDEKMGAPEVKLSNVEIAVRRKGKRHLVALTATPPAHLARAIDARGELHIERQGDHWMATGRLYGEGTDADLAALRTHVPVPETMRSGFGSVRVWADIAAEGVREITADVTLRDVRGQLAADVPQIDLAHVSGRVMYRYEPGGFYLGTENLRFRTASGLDAKPAAFSFLKRAAKGETPRGEVHADGIDLRIAATLVDYFPIPKDVKTGIAQYAPRGVITKAAFIWTGATPAQATSFELRGRFENLAIAAADGHPGASGLSGVVDGNERGGTLRLASRNATLEIASFFRAPLTFEALDADASWKREGAKLEVTVGDFHFANPDTEGRAKAVWRSIPGSSVRSPGHLEMKGTLSRANAKAIANYFPARFAVTQKWLDNAIQGGEVKRATFEVNGDLWHFPFRDNKEGRFLVEAQLADGRLKYHPDWPEVTGIDAALHFEGQHMEIRSSSASIFASRMKDTTVAIDDFGAQPPVVVFTTQIDTAGADTVRFLRESPLVNGPGAFTKAVQVEGPARLGLKLTYPLYGTEPARVAGDFQFAGATATVGKSLTMSGIKGKLLFTERGVRAPELTGTMFGQPTMLRIASQPDGVLTTLEGRIASNVMGAFVPEPIAARLDGTIDWKARVNSTAEGTDLALESDLKGLASTLPAPFAKTPDDVKPLAITIQRMGTREEFTSASLGDAARGRFATRGAPGAEHWQAALLFGTTVDTPPMKDGIWLYGDLPRLDVDAWLAVFAAKGPQSPAAVDTGPALRGFDLRLREVVFTQRQFRDLAVSLERTGTEWKGHLEGPQISGDISWNPAGKGRVAARLDRFLLRPTERPEGASAPPQAPQDGAAELPALDIVAERFEFKSTPMGRLELKAVHAGDEWRIEKLDITNGQSKFHSTGAWRPTGNGSITTLDLKVDAGNLNALFAQFGYGDYVKGGRATLEGKLAWPGFPYDFEVGKLSGNFRLDARDGQFAKIEPGAGKLLGLLSLQSIPRRVTFDFKDVFAEGFAFGSITSNVRLARGILLTDDLEINGPAAFVSMSGEVSLPQETQRLTLRVVPEVGESVALAATLIGTPVLGLSTLVVSKLLQNPLGKVVAYEYQVTGSWDNPSVTRVSAPPPKAAAAAPSPTPTP
ncbi:YhdP family protein [Usitatibacter rugosus]|uniref:YhdP family protein n=1 Tax=Usitatibacter rugosus TaxID=2732067 RepID=UPI001489EFB6|nr:YhdP family protein [Usitatibacter rugosus]